MALYLDPLSIHTYMHNAYTLMHIWQIHVHTYLKHILHVDIHAYIPAYLHT